MLTEPMGPPRTLGPPKKRLAEQVTAEPLLSRVGKGRPAGMTPTILTEHLSHLDRLESDNEIGTSPAPAGTPPILLTPAAEGREATGGTPLLKPQGAWFRRLSIPGVLMEPNTCSWNKWTAPETAARKTKKAEILTPGETPKSTTPLGQTPPDLKARPRPRSLEVCAGSGGIEPRLVATRFRSDRN